MNIKITTQMVSNRQKKKRLIVSAFVMTLFMALFTQGANAQNVYMHTGSMTVPSTGTINFYDSGGESHGPDYYWERWFQKNEEFTFTFSPAETGKKIQVTFNEFTAYLDNGGYNHAIGNDWSLRLNTAELSIYDGEEVNDGNLITTYTGNMTGAFIVVANGPITFYFHSYGYREEGWQATVKCVDSYTLQKPQISFEACSDAIVINANNKDAEIYYTTNGSDPVVADPLTGATLYDGPFNVAAGTTIKAIARLNNSNSAVATKEFTADDVTPTPGVPTITRTDNIVTMTPDAISEEINETYYVWYTDDGSEPTTTNGKEYKNPIEVTTPNTVFKAVTRAKTCSDKMSTVVELTFENVKVLTPTITFPNGNATITCNMPGVTVAIYYTTDGSTPTASSTPYSGPFAVTYGTTVKAIAVVSQAGFDNSEVATEIYVPEGGAGADGTTVILDDREEHSWSYYSDKDQPIHSLNPADVKITYYGNGKMYTSTTATPSGSLSDVTGVKVSASENESTFIYLKTLERANGDAGTGNLAYTLIPNPFTVRPKFTLQGTTYYTGFYGWRVKRLNGVTISGNYTEGSIIPAETEIQFVTNNSEGNEVDFEAVWARAYVVTSNTSTGLSTDVGYERNFIYLSSNTTLQRRGYSGYDVTYTTVDPATGSGTKRTLTIGGSNYAYFYCRGNTKFENAVLASYSNSTYLDANNFDLIVGRGVTGTVNRVYGHDETGSSNAMNFTIRLESGTFNNLWLLHSGSNSQITYSSTVSAKAILGCDYDRAKGDNAKLSIAPTNTYIEGCDGSVQFSSPNNQNNLTFDWYVKSGKIQATTSVNTGDPFYMGVYQSGDDGTQYLGKRRLTIEGGEIGTVSGACGASGTSYSTYAVNDGGWTVMIRMKNGTVNGSVYGAAVYTGANGDRRMVFTGGTVKGWIAGGCNGTEAEGGELFGDTYIYFGGKAKCDGSQTTQIGTSTSGNIMGAGSGNSGATGETATVGRVNSSNIVIADEAEVARNVYGGGNYGYVRVGTGNKSDIYVLGGTVSGSVFGGSNQQQGQIVNMWMKDGTVTGNLYGGSNTSGTVKGLATVNVSGGTVNNVFGGGYGANTDMASGTIVTINSGTINNNVYGGGALGTVSGNANVTVKGGTMKNVYGAGKGGTTTAQVSGQTFVTVSGGTISESVYGGGENGDVMASSGGGSTSGDCTYSEDFEGYNGTAYNTAGVVPTGWNIIFSGSNNNSHYSPHVATGIYNGAVISSGNGLCFTSGGSDYGNNNYAIMPSIEGELESISFTYRMENSSYGTLSLGYITNINNANTYSVLKTFSNSTTQGTEGSYEFTQQIPEGARLAFRWSYTSSWYTCGIDDICVTTTSTTPVTNSDLASTVTVTGGSITGDVFGGGRLGKTDGDTEVDVKNGTIRGSVFGGAYGASGSVYVAGMHTVNIMGGRIFGNVYGGSRNANDALAFTGYSTTETATSSVVNISAGQVDEQVYAAGFFGQTYGSVYVFVGKEAILHAPNSAPSFGDENENNYKTGKLLLAYNVWAGSDFGTFEGGSFGGPTVSGYSDIYVDGDGYDTETTDESAPSYMNIKGSLLGSGTSCDAGTKGRGIYVSNYGHALSNSKEAFKEPFSEATRTFYSIQRADTLVFDNAHLNFTGQARVNSLDASEKYAIYSFDKTVRMVGGSSLFLNAPVFQIIDFWSAKVDDLYKGASAVYTPIAYDGLGATGSATDNKIRVNGGNYIEVYHDKMTYENGTVAAGYGMLNGFAHMMVAANSANNTCAYARPKQCTPTTIANNLDNPNDGGWVSYNPDENTFSIGTYSNGTWNPVPNTGGSDQIPYENHTTTTKAGEQYFRIWRVGGEYSEREGVLNAYADGTASFDYVDVTIKLPAWRSSSAYYKFETSGSGSNLNTTINYGADVLTFPTAIATETDNTQNWVHFVESSSEQLTGADAGAQGQISQNPNVNFGLVTLAGTGMTLVSPVASQGGLIVCPESDEYLASVDENNATVNKFTCANNTVEPQVTFRLTYSNLISTNMTWDPMFITLVQCDENGNPTDIVKISLTINTYTSINNVFTTQTYAIMDGLHMPADQYTAKVVLPTFTLHDYSAAHLSQFTLTNVSFEPNNVDATSQDCWKSKGGSYDFTHFAMEIAAARNEDNSDGWNATSTGIHDSHSVPAAGILLGETGARTPIALDFTLTYNGDNNNTAFTEDEQHPALLGVLTFTIRFTNYADGNPNDDYSQNLTIKVQVIRRGVGKAFYLDGQHGSNSNSATYPNDAALTLSYIYNRCGYMPGDVIYIVNTVDVAKNLEWSGSDYGGVTIYRYPGGHPLYSYQQTNQAGQSLYYTDETQTETTTTQTEYPVMITNPIVDNEDNEAFTGALVNVKSKGNLLIRDLTLDGHKSAHESPVETATGTDAAVAAESPLITIASGGTVTLTNGSVLQENNSSANGGAVAVEDGGTLKMNQNATIKNNVTNGNGGAVYMAGTMIVSDAVQLVDNTKGTTPNNVYLTDVHKVIQIGTTDASDAFGELSETAQIGVTKGLSGESGYTEVVKVETEDEVEWLNTPYVRPNAIIFHDGHKYELEKYDDIKYLYWIGTWVTVQDWNPEYTSADVAGYDPDNFAGHLDNIDTPEELAWLISYVNGLNGASAHPGANATITKNIDMETSIWVPMGTEAKPYTGTFEGNGYVISGVRSPLVNDNVGLFGVIGKDAQTNTAAQIQDVIVEVNFTGNSKNMGSIAGVMNDGLLANVEAAGTLSGQSSTENVGGLVGLNNGGTIHSAFAVNTISAKTETMVGGLVGTNGSNLYNSYSNATFASGTTNTGGLVGVNKGTVENCYNASSATYAFAYQNKVTVDETTTNGKINYCYAAKPATGTPTYTATGFEGTLTGHGTYDAVMGRKEVGYMYADNKVVKAVEADANSYITEKDTIYYKDGKIEKWRGLLSTLNQWVTANPKTLNPAPTTWFRPTSENINGDLPILGFGAANSLATTDGKFLQYGACDKVTDNNGTLVQTRNGLDVLLGTTYDSKAYMFLYGNAVGVTGSTGNNELFINEDAVLLQSSAKGTIKATVGISFDNSKRGAKDYDGTVLEYDWHLMSTPLADAPLGINYGKEGATLAYGQPADWTAVKNSYMPNLTNAASNEGDDSGDEPENGKEGDELQGEEVNTVNWDFYTYYEPEYHWINFKRSITNHWHFDEPHDNIPYANMEQTTGNLIKGRGYMMAISQDSYLSNTGNLNNDDVTIQLTISGEQNDDPAPTRDWGSNLVGNPYQAYLNLAKVASENGFTVSDDSEEDAFTCDGFYIYDADNGTYGPYITNASVNTAVPSQFIHPHQAFFVVINGNKGTTKDLKFTYDMATTSSNDASYFRGEEQPKYPLVNLFVENEQGTRDLAVVEFNRPELNGVRKVDNLRNANFKISAHLGGTNYGLVFVPEGTERVPVHFRTYEDGTFTLKWQTMHGEFTSLILVDNLTGVRTDMLRRDHYTFNGSVDDYAARFYITYNVTDVNELNGNEEVFAYYDGNDWIVTGKGQLQVVDVTGRVLQSVFVNGDQTRLHLDDVAAGVYIMRLTDGQKSVSQKIVVK